MTRKVAANHHKHTKRARPHSASSFSVSNSRVSINQNLHDQVKKAERAHTRKLARTLKEGPSPSISLYYKYHTTMSSDAAPPPYSAFTNGGGGGSAASPRESKGSAAGLVEMGATPSFASWVMEEESQTAHRYDAMFWSGGNTSLARLF